MTVHPAGEEDEEELMTVFACAATQCNNLHCVHDKDSHSMACKSDFDTVIEGLIKRTVASSITVKCYIVVPIIKVNFCFFMF